MALLTRRRLLIAVPPLVLVLIAVAVFLIARGQDLRSRAARVSSGMPREQVESILGPPVLVLQRAGGTGTFLCWVDQLWQVDVRLDTGGRVESVGCAPSNSFLRRMSRIIPLPE